MQLSDRITGSFLIALGALAAYGGSRLPPVPGQQIGPNVFPLVVGIGLTICGALIAMRVGASFEASDTTPDPDGTTASRSQWWVLLPPALLLFYVFVSETLGFFPTAAAMVFVCALALGANMRIAVPLALLAPVGVYVIFAKLLRVPLPPGLLPMPW